MVSVNREPLIAVICTGPTLSGVGRISVSVVPHVYRITIPWLGSPARPSLPLLTLTRWPFRSPVQQVMIWGTRAFWFTQSVDSPSSGVEVGPGSDGGGPGVQVGIPVRATAVLSATMVAVSCANASSL